MIDTKSKIGVVFLVSITIVLLVSEGFSEITGKSVLPAENLKLGTGATSSSLQSGIWQLREFKHSSTYSPEFSFITVGDSVLRASSNSSLDSMGCGFAFVVIRRSDLNGFKIQIRWNAYYTYPDLRDIGLAGLHVFDKAFDRMDMTDYFKEGLDREPMFDYTHILCTRYPGPNGAPPGWEGWRTDTSDILNLDSWSSDYVTILIEIKDNHAYQSIVGDFDWIKILDADNHEVYSFDFSGYVEMEVTGTTHDYGLFQPRTPVSVYVDPSLTQAAPNVSFNANVKVANITDLYSWEFKLYYRNTILNATQIVEGSFLKSVGYTLWMEKSNPNYNVTHGLIHVGASLTGDIHGVNGTGVLAALVFRTLASGNSTLHLQGTITTDSSVSDIPHSTSDGFVIVGQYNLAVLSVIIDKNIVGNGDLCAMHVNVTVQNQGVLAESFDVTTYFNASIIEIRGVTDLAPMTNTSLEFTWHPIGVPKGNYTVGASANTVSDEMNVADNTLYNDTIVTVAMAGDLTGQGFLPDGIVNIKDCSLLASTWGSNRGELRYKPNCDINDDGLINIKDVAILGRNWGKIDP